MEIFMLVAAAWIVGVGILIWVVGFVNKFWLRPKKLEKRLRQQGFSGNSYRFFYGDLKETVMMINQAKSKPINLTDDILPRVIPFVHRMVKNYGKRSFLWLGPIPRVMIMNPEHIKEILTKMHDFPKPHSNPLIKLLATGLADHEGEKWALHRKLLNPAFHQEKMKHMLPSFEQSCNGMISKWENLVSTEACCEVDVWPHLTSLTSDAISRTAFGSSYEEGKRIFQLQTEQAQLIMQSLQSVYLPGWRFVPTKRNRRMWEVERETRAILKGMIDKRLNAIKDGKAADKDDLLGILLESNSREIKEGGKVGMSMEDVIEECKLFYFAGQETTSVLLVWTMVLLSQHPQWQSRAREEVLSVFGDNNKPSLEGLSRLKVVTMILYEVLRLYPSFLFISRTLHKDTKLGNVTIPGGVQVSMPIILVHHDPEIWGDDVREFKPERFSEGVSKATKNQVCFFPFGWGPRICIGQNFAMAEAKLAVAMILKRFWFELSPSYTHAPFPVIIALHPQHGVHIILHKLKQ